MYSLHKTSTREYLLRNITRLGGKPQVIAELRYNVENSYRFHKKKSVSADGGGLCERAADCVALGSGVPVQRRASGELYRGGGNASTTDGQPRLQVDIAVDFIRIDCRDVPRQPEGEGPEED